MTLLQMRFPGQKQPEFPMEDIPVGQYSCKIINRWRILKWSNIGRGWIYPPTMILAQKLVQAWPHTRLLLQTGTTDRQHQGSLTSHTKKIDPIFIYSMWCWIVVLMCLKSLITISIAWLSIEDKSNTLGPVLEHIQLQDFRKPAFRQSYWKVQWHCRTKLPTEVESKAYFISVKENICCAGLNVLDTNLILHGS